MQVRDAMTKATITETPADTRTAAERLWREQTGSLLITADGRLTGVFGALGVGGGEVDIGHESGQLARKPQLARIERGDQA